MEGLIFNIQKYALHDGPGIRTTVFLKGCPLSCLWCHNPESIQPNKELMLHPHKCIRCESCDHFTKAEVCPSLALEEIGMAYTVESLMSQILKDVVFYDQSHGGVTFSGGEPLMQHEFLLAVLKACKEHDIHTSLDTSGFASWDHIEPLIPYLDMVLFDLKHLNNEKHLSHTGVSNHLILENLKKLSGRSKIYIRVPLISGYNDSDADVHQLCQFLKPLEIQQINFLPYHNYAGHKYLDLMEKRHFTEFEKPSDERLKFILDICLNYELNAQIGGDIC